MHALAEIWAKHILNGNKKEKQLVIFPENFQTMVKDILKKKRAEEGVKENA